MYNLLCYGLYTFCFTLKSCLSVGTLLISLLVFEIEEELCVGGRWGSAEEKL